MLTPRQFEVLNLISRGLSTFEIAGKLKVSDNTVQSHRKELLKKFKAKNSVDLVAKAFKEKWLV